MLLLVTLELPANLLEQGNQLLAYKQHSVAEHFEGVTIWMTVSVKGDLCPGVAHTVQLLGYGLDDSGFDSL